MKTHPDSVSCVSRCLLISSSKADKQTSKGLLCMAELSGPSRLNPGKKPGTKSHSAPFFFVCCWWRQSKRTG